MWHRSSTSLNRWVGVLENDPLLLQEWLRDEIEAGTFGWGAFEITLLFPGGLPYRVMPA